MDDLTRIRDEYESALDEVESKRAEYHALIRRKAMAGRDVEDLAMETGLGDPRLHLLLRRSRWNPLVWLLRVLRGASVAGSPTGLGKAARGVSRRGLARPIIMLALLPVVGWLVLSWPITSYSAEAAVYLDPGSTRRDANQVLSLVREHAEVEVLGFQTSEEVSPYFEWEAVTWEENAPHRVGQPRLLLRFPHQAANPKLERPSELWVTGAHWRMWWSDWDFIFAPHIAGMSMNGDFGAAAQVREIVGWVLILWLPPLILAFLMARGAWRWLRYSRKPSPTGLAPA